MRKFLALFLALILIAGCSTNTPNPNGKDDPKDPAKEELFSKFTISLDVNNSDATSEEYYVYLMKPSFKESEPGKQTQSGFYGPLLTQDKQVEIDMEFNFDLNWYIEDAASTNEELYLYVTTIEDYYLINPLNTPTVVKFIENKDEDTSSLYHYGTKNDQLSVSITDKYPDGVISLPFPDATFVIKLEFESEPSKKTYEVSIHKPNPDAQDGIGIYRNGRLSREFQYWDTPFFSSDSLKDWSGYIVVTDYDTNARVNYEGYPKFVEFDENGKCVEGDVIRILVKP